MRLLPIIPAEWSTLGAGDFSPTTLIREEFRNRKLKCKQDKTFNRA
jgi:hypothetical protein